MKNTMKILGRDDKKAQELRTGTQHACHLLNEVVIPTCKELSFMIDIHDTETLDRYMRDISALHDDYIAEIMDGERNPALILVIKKTAEELWEQAYGKHNLKNPFIISDIPDDVMEFVTLTGNDIFTFHARQNNPAIAKACEIEATKEDLEKIEEIKAVCDALNKTFNGNGGLFWQYVSISHDGIFLPAYGVKNYKPLM